MTYCKKSLLFVNYYKKQVAYYNHTACENLTNEIGLILPTIPRDKKHKKGIITSPFCGLSVWHMKVFLAFYIIMSICIT